MGWLITSLAIAQSIPNETVEFNYNKVSIQEILNDIQKSYGLSFSYGSLDLKKQVDFNYSGNLQEAIDLLLTKQGLLYKEIGSQLVLKEDIPFGQAVKGLVKDLDSHFPLIGANIIVKGSDPMIGTSTDYDGNFRFDNLKVGRYDLVIEYIGYDKRVVNQVLVTTGKEVFLNINMKESTLQMDEIVIVAKDDISKPLNDMATTSARSFSVEEASRYAAAVSDPARMALSFAGVTGSGDDLANEIIVRGNSSKGLLWRLEGIEIPNPNHFSSLGSGGGSISMLSSSTLTNSDFYTGAFPAEFGNALSGVFDLKMRKGNNDKREHSFQIGTLGIEASSEGYIKKGSAASYLVNYRYSTIALIDKLLPTVEGGVTAFQDLSFKINIPTKKCGVFSIFGLGGINNTNEEMQADTTNFMFDWQLQEFSQNQSMGVVGVTHKYVINKDSYLRTSLASSLWFFDDETTQLNSAEGFIPEVIDVTDFKEYETTFNILYNRKVSARHSVRTGYSMRHKSFNYDFKSVAESEEFLSFLQNNGSSQLMDAYIQSKYKIGEKWELNTGLNVSYLTLNGTSGVDPRVGIKYQFKPKQSVSLSTGIYSKPEHVSTYFIERRNQSGDLESPNKDLPMLKAYHLVAAYDINFSSSIRLKAEAYYQYLYNIPVGSKPNSYFSTLNASDIFSLIFFNDLSGATLISEGTGKNYGIDLTLEKSFTEGYYFMATGSVFESKFTTADKRAFNTRFATNFVGNILGGKEWTVGKRKKNIIGLNGKFNFVDGLRTTPILIEESQIFGVTVFDELRFNDIKRPAYYRFDLGVLYKINAKKTTHSISADIQNITNRFNDAGSFYDPVSNEIVTNKQNGLIPFINYRIEF